MTERELKIVDAVKRHTFTALQEGPDVEKFRQRGYVATYDVACCVAATRVAYDVLRHFCIFGTPMKTVTQVYNRTLWQHAISGGSPDEAPDGSILRTAGARPKDDELPGWLNGHVILIVEKEVLLDCSAEQFSYGPAVVDVSSGAVVHQKKVDINIASLAVDLRNDAGREFLADPRENPLVAASEDYTIVYRQHEDGGGFFDAPDWRPCVDRADITEKVRRLVFEETGG